MSTTPTFWNFNNLPDEAIQYLKKTYVIGNKENYRNSIRSLREGSGKTAKTGKAAKAQVSMNSIFDLGNDSGSQIFTKAEIEPMDHQIIWATDNYEDKGNEYNYHTFLHDFSVIKPRVEKSKAEQKKRVKAKAEVFTPSWVCNVQNNLIDDNILGEGSFNTISEDQKSWVSSNVVKFTDNYPWWKYVTDRRLEMCCGEGPYLFSRYDATTGEYLPVRDDNNKWNRIGLLDRKLRVASENTDNLKDWMLVAEIALKSIYGFEWQGDNLSLARLNMINTYFDYMWDFCEHNNIKMPSGKKLNDLVINVAEITSWQLWQMDGLKMVMPDTCSKICVACKKKENTLHDGDVPVIRWGNGLKTFEEFLLNNN